jgi:hypothetical protein
MVPLLICSFWGTLDGPPGPRLFRPVACRVPLVAGHRNETADRLGVAAVVPVDVTVPE